ncbi:uncharacterized protein LOC132261396 [Phlebotomus argentipes]|uniref:uncharacterized protein LOC132261396 n=1 Tax=Phlebotomus argentipes TaxID=94469 RepID=UPI0028931121|nr:uncharacterized protein LOC132261396 [Phlebotomus argentipes]
MSRDYNPADIASRGTTAELLHESALWWRGPNWLSKPHEALPAKRNEHAEEFEQEILKTTKCHFTLGMFTTLEHAQEAFSSVAHTDDKNDTFLRKFSTYNKLIIVIALLLRFITNSKLKSEDKQSEHLTTAERQKAKRQIYRLIQQRHFPEEINALKRNSPLPAKSKIKDLYPFLDDDGVLRLTLNQLRTQFWVVKGVNYVKTVVHKCVRCARCAPKSANQLMGDLPASRVTSAPPFARCGVDYAGPIITRRNKGRENINEKSYIAIFVCLVTKAMHIEAVSDLSTESFIAALQRFIARSGKPAIIMSDNGTNFVGAKRTLDKEVAQAVKRASKSVVNTLAHEGIQWKFIPPGTPHFGRLWEAAVKSVKYHLIRATWIGRELTAPPERDELEATPINRWRQITKIQQQLWKRWSQEYLTTLQQRTKWRDQTSNPEIGDLVLLREDNSPPLK